MTTHFTIIAPPSSSNNAIDNNETTQQTNNANTHRDQRILEQMNNILEDSTISLHELEKSENEAFSNYVVEVLGYGSVRAFVRAHCGRTETQFENFRTEIPLNPESVNAIEKSITGSLFGEGFRFTADESSELPTNIDDDTTFVEFTLLDGQKITFDGPGSGKAANAFATGYNHSDTFAETIHQLAEKQSGQYGFHLLPLKQSNKGIVVGINFSGTDLPFQQSGVFLQSEFQYNMLKTIIHEVGHDLHGDSDEDLFHTGQSHSREHSMFLSVVVNEIETKGVDTGINVDADDYSSDTLIFDTSFRKNDHQTVRSEPRVDYQNYQSLYEELQTAINSGDFRQAKEIWDNLPPNAEIELSFKTPKVGWGETQTFNVRTLFLQDLMLSADSGHRFNDDTVNINQKFNLGVFLNIIVLSDFSTREAITTAAEEIGYELENELPIYAFSSGPYNFNQIFNQA